MLYGLRSTRRPLWMSVSVRSMCHGDRNSYLVNDPHIRHSNKIHKIQTSPKNLWRIEWILRKLETHAHNWLGVKCQKVIDVSYIQLHAEHRDRNDSTAAAGKLSNLTLIIISKHSRVALFRAWAATATLHCFVWQPRKRKESFPRPRTTKMWNFFSFSFTFSAPGIVNDRRTLFTCHFCSFFSFNLICDSPLPPTSSFILFSGEEQEHFSTLLFLLRRRRRRCCCECSGFRKKKFLFERKK